MNPFTHDVESTDLSGEEASAFAHLVQFACYTDTQSQLSCFLSMIMRPQAASVMNFVDRQAGRMWRQALRVLASPA
jgi:hypothetical protein